MQRRRAALELTLLTVLVLTALVGTFAIMVLHGERTWLLGEVQNSLSLASDILLSNLREGMMRNDRAHIQDSLSRVIRDTRIEQVRIFAHRGSIGLSTRSEESAARVGRDAPSCVICHAGRGKGRSAGSPPLSPQARTRVEGGTMKVYTPILAEPACLANGCHSQEAQIGVLGVIDLRFSLGEVEAALRRRGVELGCLALAALLLGGGLLWLTLGRRFRQPMRKLLRGIRRVADGELSHRLTARIPDEFGELADSFNIMSQRLSTLQQGLIQSERLISMGKLAAGVAHEINNPLTGILSYAEDLLEDTDPSDPRHNDYEVIVREALRCRQIVRSLLDFARQDAPILTRVHPGDLISRALEAVVRRADFRDIHIERQIEDSLPSFEADSTQLQQVLLNLIVNAQQAKPAGGRIVVGARSVDGGRIELWVQDEGQGIPPEIRTRIFEPFFSTKGGKTDGLGLAVCLGIVQQHQGTIRVESETGKGSTFRITLPLVRSPDETPKRKEETPDGGTYPSRR